MITFPSAVFICIDSASILSTQVRKYFAITALIVLLVFFSIVSLTSTLLLMVCLLLAFVSILLPAFGSIFLSQLYSYFTHFCQEGSDNIPDDVPLSHFVYSVGLYYHYLC